MPKADAEYIIKRNNALKAEREINDTDVQQINELFLPRRSDVQTEKTPGIDGWTDRIYETTPINAAQVCAAGQYDLLFTGKWFETNPPIDEMDEEAQLWYKEVGPKMMARLSNSNFPLEIQEFLLDRTVPATALIHIDEDDVDGIRFVFTPYGQYSIAEDDKKRVDTVFREFKMSARQMALKFGEDNLGPKAKKALASKDGGKQDKVEFCIIHAIYRRQEFDSSKADADNMPWASIYVCTDDKIVLREGGYQEQPFAVSRFHRWGNTPYGYGPAWLELPTARQLQFIEKSLDAQTDAAVNPGILVGDDQEDDIDRFGVTTISLESAAAGLPRFWPTQSRYDWGKDRLQDKIRRIESSFFVDMFQMLTSDLEQKREKTAYEVSKMLEEQMSKASPTFYRLLSETLPIILNRVFSIMLRRGELGDPPEGAFVQTQDGAGVETPAIVFTSKLAQAMKAVENNTLIAWLNTIGMFKTAFPEMVQVDDNVNGDYIVRRLTESLGLWPRALNFESQVEARREQRQKVEQAQMALQAGEMVSKIQKNVGQ